MLREFSKRLFFPVQWANSVTAWLCNISSPSGTVKIHNTVNPSEGNGPTIDVDVDAVAGKVKTKLGLDTSDESSGFVRRIRDIIRLFLDGVSVVWKSGRVSVSEQWVARMVEEYAPDVKGESTAPVFNDDVMTNNVYDLKRSSTGNTSTATTYVPSASLDTASWTRDTTAKDDTTPCGVRFQVVSRIQRASVYDVIYWRWATFDAYGMLRLLSAEQGCFVVVNVNGYSGV